MSSLQLPGRLFVSALDNQGYGFDNIGYVLTLSPMLMEKYMSAARSLSRIAVYGESYESKPGIVGKLLVKSVQDDGHVSGNNLPFSIRGTLDGVYRFPVEADYVLQFRIANRRGAEPGVDLSPNAAGAGADLALCLQMNRRKPALKLQETPPRPPNRTSM